MPPGTRHWERGRKAQSTRQLRRILVLCEDTKSSRDYLDRFPRDPRQVQIECVGTGKSTDSLMAEALVRKERAEYAHAPYETIWVVFDKDDFSLQSFNRAFDLARAHPSIRVCWANECFELWYLLHFELRQTETPRAAIWAKLSEHLDTRYEKGDEGIFVTLAPRLQTALNHAKRLEFINAELGEPRRNPSTNVHKLVETLRAFDPKHQSG